MRGRHHPTRHLLYAFAVGAAITALGFVLAYVERRSAERTRNDARLIVAGSETLRPWFTACGQVFMDKRHDIDVVVRGGGTSAGIAALLAGQIDLALSSRELTEGERLRGAKASGGVRSWPVATAAVAVIVHPQLAVERLDLSTLAQLLDGTRNDWAALGRRSAPVLVVGREGGSGTSYIVQQLVLGARPLAPAALRLASHGDVIEAVASTPGAIGYADASLARRAVPRVKLLALHETDAGQAVLPDTAKMRSGKYPLARTLHVISAGPLQGLAGELVSFCRDATREHLLDAAGLMPPLAPAPAPASVAAK